MGERKGTNLYYPPDYDPKRGGINKFLGTHPLRERARKLDEGILIIRFEMPFNIWCNGCGKHIGMGVRYNAEKKKIGNFYSSPIWRFRMKCHLCDNHFEIKTDPETCQYIVESGARRQENRWDPSQNDQVVPEDKETQKRLFDDAMFKLEHGDGDKKNAQAIQPALAKLTEKQTDEERAAKKRKVLLSLYEGHKSRQMKELAEKNPLRSTILNSVRKKSDGIIVECKDENNSENKSTVPETVTSASLVSGDYDSSSSDGNA
ncbi:Coiled-coil domain-containing protein 130 [Blattella germanica]|nr:Coiled-coil domain-containing protein 130 [Blattella germanica]